MGINYKISDFYYPILRILQDGANGGAASEIIQILIVTKNIDALRLPELWSSFRLKIKNQIRLARVHLTEAGYLLPPHKNPDAQPGWFLSKKGKNTNLPENELVKAIRVEVRKQNNKRKSSYAIGENGKLVKEAIRTPYERQKKEYVFNKNIIFYGPPATGKTQEAIQLALQILKIDTSSEEKRKETLRSQIGKQIEFITFHQSYSYEDFVQGLRPFTNNTHTLSFELKDGVFKRIADRAKQHYEAYQKSQKKQQIPFEALLDRLLIEKVNADTEEIELEVENPQGVYNALLIYEITENHLFYKRKNKRDQVKEEQRELSIRKLKKLFETQQESSDPLNGKYYNAVIHALQALTDNLEDQEETKALKNFVIIIDEINRANISAVFGELITLIEPDKRLGAPNEVFATLPSGETFIVPPNLYIIGTMNTADKSIAMLDMALRRRFEFLPVYPKYHAPDIAYGDFLKALNNQIKEKKGTDFMIGQAYFLMHQPHFDFIRTLNRQIIPLLNEYFNHQTDKVKKLLAAALEEAPSTQGKFEVDEDEYFLLKVIRSVS